MTVRFVLLGVVLLAFAPFGNAKSRSDPAESRAGSRGLDVARAAARSRPCGAPIVIRVGGTYSGCWSSQTDQPAVTVLAMSPVTIVNATIAGPGELVRVGVKGARVHIRGVTANGGTGRFLVAEDIRSFTLINSTLTRTTGIYLRGASADARILITRNKQLNVQPASDPTQFVQLDKVTTASIEISWNEVVNQFGQSGVEDNISLYKTSNAVVANNFIDGGYPAGAADPYSGSGIMIDEIGSSNNRILSNQILNTTNAGIGIAGGHSNSVLENRVVFDGRTSDGRRLSAANVGLFAWNLYKDPAWSDNVIARNVVGWVNSSGGRNDWWLPDCASGCVNQRMRGRLDRRREQAERSLWEHKLAANGVVPGAGGAGP